MTKSHHENVTEEFENVISKTGFEKYNISLLFTCGLGVIAVYGDSLSMAIITPAAKCDLNLSLNETLVLSSIVFIGSILSGFMWGAIADSFGRRNILVICLFMSFVCGIGSSLSPYPWLLILFRFIDGFFSGCPFSIIIPYLGEFHGNKYRNKMISCIGIFTSIQLVFIASFALVILPMNWAHVIPGFGVNMKPWRYLIVFYSIPTLLSALLLLMYPESPKYLWDSGQIEEALVVLENIQKVNNNKYTYNFQSFEFKPKTIAIVLPNEPPKLIHFKIVWNQIVALYKMPFLPSTLMISFIQFGLSAGANGLFLWAPQIFDDLKYYTDQNNNETVTVCGAMNYSRNKTNSLLSTENITECSEVMSNETFIIIIILGICYSITFILIGILNHFMSNKFLLVIVLLVTAISALLIQIFNQYLYIVIAMGVFIFSGPSLIILQNIIVEIYPTKKRGMAMCVAQFFGSVGGFCGIFVCGYTLQYYCSITFILYTVINLVLLIITCFIPLPFFPSKNTTAK